MPVPYPVVFNLVGAEVGVNFLYLGRPKVVPVSLRLGANLSRPQWEAVQRIEKALLTWTTVSPIGPVEMGRTPAKMEDVRGSCPPWILRSVPLTTARETILVTRRIVIAWFWSASPVWTRLLTWMSWAGTCSRIL